MPGSNDYSISPDIRANSEKTSDPTLVARPTTTQTLLIKGSNLPEVYKMQDFDMDAWVASVLKERYGTDGSNRDFRRLNRYISSLEGLKALELAKANHRASEMLKYTAAQQKLNASQKESDKQDSERVAQKAIAKGMAPSYVAPKQPIKPKWKATNADIDAGAQTYTVKSGNTLGLIVSDYNNKNKTNLKIQDVANWSGITDLNKINIGLVIRFTNPNISQNALTATTTPSATSTPIVNNGTTASDSVTVEPVTTINTDSISGRDSIAVKIPTIDSLGVTLKDTGMVSRTDSTLNIPTDSITTQLVDSVSTETVPKNFTWTGLYFNYPTENLCERCNIGEIISDQEILKEIMF